MAKGSPRSHAARRQRQLARYGSEAERKKDAMVRLGELIDPQPSGCWEFRGSLGEYGYFASNQLGTNRQQLAHRLVYEVLVGPIPEGHHLHHECENPGCVNPKHLRPLTPGDHRRWHAKKAS